MDNPIIFNFDRVCVNRAYAADHMDGYDFLFQKAAQRLADNLKDINRNYDHIAVVGSRGLDTLKSLIPHVQFTVYDIVDDVDHVMTSEIPEMVTDQYDCIIVLPYIHTVNNVPAFLQAIKTALKPDGVFLSAFFGGSTLNELRQSIMAAELEQSGGVAQHIHPMIDHYQYAGLLQSMGFALPVVDYDRIKVEYSAIESLYEDIIKMGEGNALMQRPPSIEPIKSKIENHYRNNFFNQGYVTTCDIVYGIGWAPHESQPKPAARGSADISLTEIL